MNVPNVLTSIRLLLVPVFAYAYFTESAGPKVSLIIFLIASATDYLDGYLARKWNQITSFGKLFDPLADKMMLLTALFCLVASGHAPLWVFCVMLAKELLMVAGSLFMLNKKVVVYSNIFGKAATVLFIAAVALLFPIHSISWLSASGTVLLYVALLSSILALVVYTMRFLPLKNNQPAD